MVVGLGVDTKTEVLWNTWGEINISLDIEKVPSHAIVGAANVPGSRVLITTVLRTDHIVVEPLCSAVAVLVGDLGRAALGGVVASTSCFIENLFGSCG